MVLPVFDSPNIAVYIHWAFCESLCPYCDFNSYVANQPILQKQWLQGYINAFNMQKPFFKNKPIKSIFFGGGTPSLMEPELVYQLINYWEKHNKSLGIYSKIPEVTLESNPSTFEVAKFQDFKQAGVNRLSTGVQSFNAKNLEFLGRKHSVQEAIYALEKSYEIFNNTSFDLIMGLPQQSLQNFQADLQMACSLAKYHLAIYQLTIEKGTVFYKKQIPEAKEELAMVFYNETIAELAKVGLLQYEISNFAKASYESSHNLNYWLGGEYLGFGPNASGRVFHNSWHATREFKNPKVWLTKALKQETLLVENIPLTNTERFEEVVLTSLRLNQAIPKYIVNKLPKEKVTKLVFEKLLGYQGSNLLTTAKGKLCLNYVIQTLLV